MTLFFSFWLTSLYVRLSSPSTPLKSHLHFLISFISPSLAWAISGLLVSVKWLNSKSSQVCSCGPWRWGCLLTGIVMFWEDLFSFHSIQKCHICSRFTLLMPKSHTHKKTCQNILEWEERLSHRCSNKQSHLECVAVLKMWVSITCRESEHPFQLGQKTLHWKGSLLSRVGPEEGTPWGAPTKEVGLMIQEADQKQDSNTPLFPAESRPTLTKWTLCKLVTVFLSWDWHLPWSQLGRAPPTWFHFMCSHIATLRW